MRSIRLNRIFLFSNRREKKKEKREEREKMCAFIYTYMDKTRKVATSYQGFERQQRQDVEKNESEREEDRSNVCNVHKLEKDLTNRTETDG